jgi:hypothetical protein
MTPTDEIWALHDQELLFVQGACEWIAHLEVNTAEPNSPQRGKVSVMVWQTLLEGVEGPWEDAGTMPPKVGKHNDTSTWRRFVTQDGLGLIRPRNLEQPAHVDYVMPLPDEPESSDH